MAISFYFCMIQLCYNLNYPPPQELKEELKARQKELQNLEDAETEIMMLDDEDGEAIPIQVEFNCVPRPMQF